jgi:type IV secretion system protein VirB4
LAAELARRLSELRHAMSSLEVYLEDLGPEPLAKREAFRFFRRLVNGFSDTGSLKYDTHVDQFLTESALECHPDHLTIGTTTVKVLSMKDAPSSTFASMLDDLYVVPGEFVACLQWQRLTDERVRRDLHVRRLHFAQKRTSMLTYLMAAQPRDVLVDDSATAVVSELGSALTDMEVQRHFFGACSLTIVMRGPEVDRTASSLGKVLSAHDGSFIAETYNLLQAWASILPGNGVFNLRQLALLETHCADLSFLCTVDEGTRVDPAGRPPLLQCTTQQGTPYAYHLHVQDVGHTLLLGATGSGKTYLANAVVDGAQQYQPRTVIFDIGHGYRELAQRHHGGYLSFGLSGLSINPFNFPPTPDHLHFLASFVQVLVEDSTYRMDEAMLRDVYRAVQAVYVLPPMCGGSLRSRCRGRYRIAWRNGGTVDGLARCSTTRRTGCRRDRFRSTNSAPSKSIPSCSSRCCCTACRLGWCLTP